MVEHVYVDAIDFSLKREFGQLRIIQERITQLIHFTDSAAIPIKKCSAAESLSC